MGSRVRRAHYLNGPFEPISFSSARMRIIHQLSVFCFQFSFARAQIMQAGNIRIGANAA